MNQGRPAEVLVVGVGNGLRADDGFGCLVVERLVEDPRIPTAKVISCHQLTPELAEDVAGSRLVVLVDARLGDGPPGSLRVERLDRERMPARLLGHAVDMYDVVAITESLYGAAPPVVVVSVRAERLELGEELSAVVEAAVPAAIEAVVSAVKPM